MRWEESLLNFQVIDSNISLRFGRTNLSVSTLAAQLYCEQKVEYEEKFGKQEKEILQMGTEIHDTLIPTKSISRNELVKNIKSKETYTAIFPVVYNHENVSIVGIHDGLIFFKGTPRYLLEIKTTRNPHNLGKVYPSEHFQAFLYALSLEQMGFDISKLRIIIPKVLQNVDRGSLLPSLLEYLKGNESLLFRTFGEKVQIHQFSLNKKKIEHTVNTIEDLIYYWTENRDPRGVKNYLKCKVCEFNTSCPKSLI